MHTCNPVLRTLPRALAAKPQRIIVQAARPLSTTTPRNMSVFQRSFYGEEPSFTGLFRMLDDFENYSREVQTANGKRHGRQTARCINPRFDLRETEKTYELHGELPGIDRENVSIEFPEPQTMVIRGRVERNYSSGSPAAVEDGQTSGALTESTEENSHKATVSDEETESAKEKGEAPSTTEVAKEKQEKPKSQERYWHQERSIGEFHRTFTFNHRVDDSAVSAGLSNGILSVTVPKADKPETRRIAIN